MKATNRESQLKLQALLEAADLIAMIEDLLQPGSIENLSQARASGLRICLKNVKRNIIDLHEDIRSEMQQPEENAPTISRGRSLAEQIERQQLTLSKQAEPELEVSTEVTASEDSPAQSEPRRRILQSPIARTQTSTSDLHSLIFGRE